jgi:hypothetical protein
MSEDSEFEMRARARLRQSVADLGPKLRFQLDGMATRAARESPRSRLHLPWRVALPLGGGVMAVALAVVMWRGGDARPVTASARADDLALLLNVDNLDLLEQMEFYQWLERDPRVLEESVAATAGAPRS